MSGSGAEAKSTRLELTFLGSGNAFAGDRYWSSFVLNRRFLFDAPPTLLAHLNKLQIPTLGIDAVLLSHFHADHFFGLPFLFLDYEYVNERTEELLIVGPPGVEEKVERLNELGFPGLARKNQRYRRHYLEVAAGKDYPVLDLTVRPIRMEHAESLDCFGYRVRLGERVLAYAGDAEMTPAVLELARGADVLVVECSCWEGACSHHIGLDDIRRLRAQIPSETTLILTHLEAGRPRLDMKGVLVAEDFATYRL
jgi:ribonuclease BN (tRNA processing enzyme)